jgi:hypothetical protein
MPKISIKDIITFHYDTNELHLLTNEEIYEINNVICNFYLDIVKENRERMEINDSKSK